MEKVDFSTVDRIKQSQQVVCSNSSILLELTILVVDANERIILYHRSTLDR